jgi:site-specific DNA-cytosine methylase
MGEQVAAAVGKSWLDGVSADLEGIGYATGAAVIPACAVDAPHRRDRLWFVADAQSEQAQRQGQSRFPSIVAQRGVRDVANPDDHGCQAGLGNDQAARHGDPVAAAGGSDGSNVADANGPRSAAWLPTQDGRHERLSEISDNGSNRRTGAWGKYNWLAGADGKARRVEPSICLLVDGVSNCLANVLSICEVASQRINDHAERSQTDPGEVLRMVRQHLYEGASGEEQSAGMCGKLYAPKVLLDFMLSQATACNRAANSSGVKKAGKETVAGAMRIMRMDGGFVHSPCQLQSDGQQRIQSSNPLHELSFLLACDTQAFGEAVFDAHAAINRVGMLRGYGNAIVPQVAAEIIGAYMEATEAA